MTTEYRQIQVRQDTAARWKSANPILTAGEFGYETDTGDLKIGDGTTRWKKLLGIVSEAKVAEQIAQGIYKGVDLSTKFAAEIADYASVFAWLHARIQAGNFTGIYPGDYFYASCSAGTVGGNSVSATNRKCVITGINIYKQTGSKNPAMPNHITVYAGNTTENVQWNESDCNNGTEANPCPWLASKIYAVLNGVNNAGTAYGSNSVGYDASAGGYLQLFPSELRGYMVNQSVYLPKRYSATGLVTEYNGNVWGERGLLFVPSEIEIYGSLILAAPSNGINNAEGHGPWCQWPLFRTCGDAGRFYFGRAQMWLSSVVGGHTGRVCLLSHHGHADAYSASDVGIKAPLCFHMG